MIYHKQLTQSTNDDARSSEYQHMDVIWAEQQSAGRGQRGHSWHSREGENLTFSVVLTPEFLPIVEQFLLSEIVALSLVEALSEYGVECRIKWTNDIYTGDNKIVGVLIEHSLSGDKIVRTIAGIGINVNQLSFPDDLPNPTSMAVVSGMKHSREDVLASFLRHLEVWYDRLERGEKRAVEESYRELMYHLDEQHTYAYPSGERFEAIIRAHRWRYQGVCLQRGGVCSSGQATCRGLVLYVQSRWRLIDAEIEDRHEGDDERYKLGLQLLVVCPHDV